ncbi:hypothetical protein ACEQPO_23975 [Bacillus sp. SL00103]
MTVPKYSSFTWHDHTNIEGSKNFSERALASIKSELKKRQRLFDQYHVNHINDYTKLYKEKKAEQAVPRFILNL